MDKSRYIILIVAAGNSRRLGELKQLVKWKGTTLLQHTVNEAGAIENCEVVVVLGDPTKSKAFTLSNYSDILRNPNWNKGMGNSIAFGIKNIELENYDGIIISVCDQPFILQENYQNLISLHQKKQHSIVVSRYQNGSKGPPSLFGAQHFKELAELEGDFGAKEIIQKNLRNVGYVDFPKGNIDIDTQQDLDKLRKES